MSESHDYGQDQRLRSTQLVISKLETYSQTYDHKISQLYAHYKSLVLEQQRLKAFMTSHQCLIAPIRRLLPEILQQIFVLCLPETHNAVMYNREAPLLLGQICSEWRQIAHSIPELWSSIHIVVPTIPWDPEPNQYALGPPIHIISEWLSRSEIFPLSISMRSTSNLRTLARMDIKTQKYMEAIIPFSRRWRSLKLSFGGFDWGKLFSQLSMEDVPMLEELHIGGRFRTLDGSMYSDYSQITRKQSIVRAPNLRRISLPAFCANITHLPINWQHLTSFDLYHLDLEFSQIIELLSRCPNLENCSIPCEKPYDGFELTINIESFKPISLHKLISLKLVCQIDMEAESYLIYFLQLLHTPNLRYLSFGEVSGYLKARNNTDNFFTALSSFKSRLVQPLEELRLDAFWWSSAEVVAVLKTFPEVKRLSLETPSNPTWVRAPVDRYRRGGYYGYRRRPTATQFVWNDEQLEMFMVNQKHGCSEKEKHHQNHSLPPSQNLDMEMGYDKPEYLCPNLEVLCCTGAVFTADVLFKFLRFRRSSTGTRLQKATITFTPGHIHSISMNSFRKSIEKIEEETGLTLEVRFEGDLLRPEHLRNAARKTHSPYDGLQNEQLRWTYATWSGNTKVPTYFGFQ